MQPKDTSCVTDWVWNTLSPHRQYSNELDLHCVAELCPGSLPSPNVCTSILFFMDLAMETPSFQCLHQSYAFQLMTRSAYLGRRVENWDVALVCSLNHLYANKRTYGILYGMTFNSIHIVVPSSPTEFLYITCCLLQMWRKLIYYILFCLIRHTMLFFT